MLAQTIFSLAQASPSQVIAFFGVAVVTIAFFVWVAYLVRDSRLAESPQLDERWLGQGDLS